MAPSTAAAASSDPFSTGRAAEGPGSDAEGPPPPLRGSGAGLGGSGAGLRCSVRVLLLLEGPARRLSASARSRHSAALLRMLCATPASTSHLMEASSACTPDS
mmetsp:Transcript_7135/g.20647  ORF Transcript_7135/g.20647 Transcript_7135/m.20647 type:complete len:103 (+) Transcript_7135:222-530(+)